MIFKIFVFKRFKIKFGLGICWFLIFLILILINVFVKEVLVRLLLCSWFKFYFVLLLLRVKFI